MQAGSVFFLGAWPRLCGQIRIKILFGGEPVATELLPLDQPTVEKVADVTRRVARILRRLLDRNPFRQGTLL